MRVERWENLDEWDVGVYLADGHRWRVDVKDHQDAQTIIDRPPVGRRWSCPTTGIARSGSCSPGSMGCGLLTAALQRVHSQPFQGGCDRRLKGMGA
ncbi:hypothetical protein L1856_06100 [Streptomyces sp. Tue 6430]|nr:hypothetical protein [Streptomyces sp. Tue 6430]